MGELLLIGMGLHDENGLTLRGLDAARNADVVYAEFYTSIMPGLSLDRLQRLVGKEIRVLKRNDLEEDADRTILSRAKQSRVALLTPGDPMSATTHLTILLEAKKIGIPVRLVHSASIVTAAAGVTGLEVYKFGRTITIPSPRTNPNPESVYEYLEANRRIGLHTLGLLDIDDPQLTIPEAISVLVRLEGTKKAGVLAEETLTIALARVESPDCIVRVDTAGNLMKSEFGGPPFSIIVPSKLHFMEAESLRVLAGAPPQLLEAWR